MRSDRKLAALRVVKVVIGGEVFVLEKDFPHVTLWKAKEVDAVESNTLGGAEGGAEIVALAAPLALPSAIRLA